VTFLVVVASSAHADPAAPSLSEARPVGETVIDFRGDPSVTLWSRPRGAAGEFRPLCVAPCTARLPPGAHALALSHDDGSPRDADTVVAGGYTTMTGAYESRGLLRAGGLALGLTSLLLGAYLLATSVQPIACPHNVNCADAGPDPAHILPAFGLLVAGVPIGIVLLTKRDRATISVAPGASTTAQPTWQGLSVRATF
jgi:hypothetical protein